MLVAISIAKSAAHSIAPGDLVEISMMQKLSVGNRPDPATSTVERELAQMQANTLPRCAAGVLGYGYGTLVSQNPGEGSAVRG